MRAHAERACVLRVLPLPGARAGASFGLWGACLVDCTGPGCVGPLGVGPRRRGGRRGTRSWAAPRRSACGGGGLPLRSASRAGAVAAHCCALPPAGGGLVAFPSPEAWAPRTRTIWCTSTPSVLASSLPLRLASACGRARTAAGRLRWGVAFSPPPLPPPCAPPYGIGACWGRGASGVALPAAACTPRPPQKARPAWRRVRLLRPRLAASLALASLAGWLASLAG